MKETVVKGVSCEIATEGRLIIERIGLGIGILIYDGKRKIGVGVHVLAPSSGDIKYPNPVTYANTAVPYAVNVLKEKGGQGPYSVAIAGAATMLNMKGKSSLSGNLIQAVCEALAKANLSAKIDQTGGNQIRTMVLDIDQGKIGIR
ncbi:MAG: hypothetical protein JXA35_08210 [Deltaproteobacteria bacterium]|nr:hypothetical protein [Deltaproteobacteria bacterium]